MNQNTCKDCQERTIGCHASCAKYQQFRQERDEYNAQHLVEITAKPTYKERRLNGKTIPIKRRQP